MNEGLGKDFLQERQFSEEVRAIQSIARLEKLLSSSPSRKSVLKNGAREFHPKITRNILKVGVSTDLKPEL